MFFRPAFHYDFLIGIELNRVAALPMQVAKEAILPSAEREVRHGRCHADVDPDIARWRFITEASRRRTAGREERRLISVGAAFEERQRFVHIVGVNQAEHRTEDFRIGDLTRRRHIIENRRLHEIPRFQLRNLRMTPVEQNLRSLLLANSDQ